MSVVREPLYVLWQVLTLRLFASGETKMESNAIEVIELTVVSIVN